MARWSLYTEERNKHDKKAKDKPTCSKHVGKWSQLVSELTEEVVFGLEVPWEYIFEGDNEFSYERMHRKLIECLALSWSNTV